MHKINIICEKNNCTGCGACISICTQNCISWEEDEMGNVYPKINFESCIQCGLCRCVCPHFNAAPKRDIRRCYAAWSNDISIRENGASGGIASELYLYLLKKGYKVAGTEWSNRKVKFKISENFEDVSAFRNSKYVYSSMEDCYVEIGNCLKSGNKLLFIGLPCQVAAVNNYCKITKADTKNLILVDLICHGVMPSQYLISHIKEIEKKKKRKAEQIFFRDPKFHTDTFYFTLADKDGIFYQKRVQADDCYQEAYHRALAYRENCYHCEYACRKRSGDLSLCDFTSVGKIEKASYTNRNVSCVMVNTDKGEDLWNEVVASGAVWSEERPVEEIVNFERQLNAPSKKHRNRDKFEKVYIKSGNFAKAARYALRVDISWNVINYILPLRKMNDFRKKRKRK